MTAALFALMLSGVTALPCEGEQPFHTTIRAIAEEPERFDGVCVRVVAYSDGRSLFARRNSMRIRSMKRNSVLLRDEMIGVYDLPTLPDTLRKRQWDSGLKWTLVGKVDLCSDMYRRAREKADAEKKDGEITLVMMTGYCHYLDGPVLLVTHGEVISESWLAPGGR